MPRRSRAEQRAETRARLIAAAKGIFVDVGFHAASIEDITDQAGFSRGAFYWNFDSKEDLFLTVAEEALEERVAHVRSIFDNDPTPDAFFSALTRDNASRTGTGDWSFAFTEFAFHAVRNPDLRQRLAALQQRVRDTTAELVEAQASALGLILPLPASELAMMEIALEDGLWLQRLIDPDNVPEDFLFRFLTYVLNSMQRRAT